MRSTDNARSIRICATLLLAVVVFIFFLGCKKKADEDAPSAPVGLSAPVAPPPAMRAEGIAFFTELDKMIPD
ncbi:MAG: hypothetical protein V2A74_01585, partial [bacterium]